MEIRTFFDFLFVYQEMNQLDRSESGEFLRKCGSLNILGGNLYAVQAMYVMNEIRKMKSYIFSLPSKEQAIVVRMAIGELKRKIEGPNMLINRCIDKSELSKLSYKWPSLLMMAFCGIKEVVDEFDITELKEIFEDYIIFGKVYLDSDGAHTELGETLTILDDNDNEYVIFDGFTVLDIEGNEVGILEGERVLYEKKEAKEYGIIGLVKMVCNIDLDTSEETEKKEKQSYVVDIPEKLNTDMGRELLRKAIDAGFCNNGYVWIKTKALLSYFAMKASDYLGLSKGIYNGKRKISWRCFEILFNVKHLALTYKDWDRIETPPSGYEGIDLLFT